MKDSLRVHDDLPKPPATTAGLIRETAAILAGCVGFLALLFVIVYLYTVV